MRPVRMSLIALVGWAVSVTVVAVISLAGAFVAAGPASASGLGCRATVLNTRFNSYGMVTIDVKTSPHAEVSATESAAARSWSMGTVGPANVAGIARLNQRVAPVAKYELVRVSVQVSLDGSTGHCTTSYTPSRLSALN
ncbi:MAG: hypothetical protein WCF25_04985 [Acidimicrobiales bacterium]